MEEAPWNSFIDLEAPDIQGDCGTLLSIVGTLLDVTDGLVRGIVFDGHLAHSYVRRLLFGLMKSIDMRVSTIPWFKDLQ